MKIAELANTLLDHYHLHESFLADMTVAKYCNYLALNRQAEKHMEDTFESKNIFINEIQEQNNRKNHFAHLADNI